MNPRINDFAIVTMNEARFLQELEEREIVTGLSGSLLELVYDRFNAITTMHELGHLYGLNHHGVSETPPSSPSYRSIMSSTYALFGVPQTNGPSQVFVIDYSREWTVNLDWRISQARNTLGALTLINGQNGEHPDFYDQTHPSLAAQAETAETNDPEPQIDDLLDDPEIAAQAVDFFEWVEGLDCEGADVATCHPGTGIAGTVTDDTTGEPVGQVCVMAENPDSGAQVDGPTAPDGTYSLDALVPGDYVVRFVDCSGAGYLAEFFDDTNDRAQATPVHVDEGVTVDGIDAALTLGGTLSGTVTADDTGEPLENVCVEAHGLDIDEGWVVSSGSDGAYEIHGMPAGSFTVRFYDCGGNGYLAEYFDDVTAQDAATPVSVTAGETTAGIDAGLALGGTISGTVTDDTTGDPVEGICVAAYVADGDGDNGIGWDDVDYTATDGTYTLDALTGDYRVQFADCLDRGYDGEYFDDTTVSADATRVAVTAPDTTGGIDAALSPAGSDGGDVTAPTVEVSAPADGAVYVQGAAVTAEYSCADEPGGSGLAWCSAATASGSPLDISEAGTHEFTVNAADNAGNTIQVTHTYTVTTGPPDHQTNTLRIKKRTAGGVPDGATFAIRVRCFTTDGHRYEHTVDLHAGQATEIDVPADHPRCVVHETDNGDATSTTYNATSTTAVAVSRPRSGRVQFGDAGGQRARVIVTNRFPAP